MKKISFAAVQGCGVGRAIRTVGTDKPGLRAIQTEENKNLPFKIFVANFN
jgi:hypothetical protein